MSITAVIEKGLIKLPKNVPWKSGTVVRIEAVDEQSPTILDALKEFDGMADDLPANASLAYRVADLAGIGRGEYTDLSINKAHLNDFGR